MRKGLIIAIALIVIIVVGLFIAYTYIESRKRCVEEIEVSISGFPTLKPGLEGSIPLKICNPCDFDIYVEKLHYKLYVGDKLLSEGTEEDVYIPAGQSREIHIPFSIKLGGVWEWLKTTFTSGKVPWKLDIVAKVPITLGGLKITEEVLTLTRNGTTDILAEVKKAVETIVETAKEVAKKLEEKAKEVFAEEKRTSKEYKVLWLDMYGNPIDRARPGERVKVCIYSAKPRFIPAVIRIKQDLAFRPDKVVREIKLENGIPPEGCCEEITIESAWGLRAYFVEIYIPSENVKYVLKEDQLPIEK